MAWIVSKIIGDGKSTETAFTTAAQQYGLRILNADHIPVNSKTGVPLKPFAMLEIPDGMEAVLLAEAGAYVVPDKVASLSVAEKAVIATKLSAQGCVVSIATATKGADLVTVIKGAAK